MTRASYQISDTFFDCKWGLETVNCSHIFKQEWTDSGLCFTLNNEQNGQLQTQGTGELGGLWLTVDIQQHEYVYGYHKSAGVLVRYHIRQQPVHIQGR